jgi:hypothetical protein
VSRLSKKHDSRITDALKEWVQISSIQGFKGFAMLRNLLREIA